MKARGFVLRFSILSLCVHCSLAMGGVESFDALGIQKAFKAAVEYQKLNQTYAERRSLVGAEVTRARGAILPSVTGIATTTRRDIAPLQTTLARINLTQPLFQGLKEFASLRVAKLMEVVEEYEHQTRQRKLMVGVSGLIFEIQRMLKDYQGLRTVEGLTLKRIQELERRSRIGRTRMGEVLSAQAQLASTQAQLKSDEAELGRLKAKWVEVTGLDSLPALSTDEALDGVLKKVEVSSTEDTLKLLFDRSDLQGLQNRADQTEENVAIARGDHFGELEFFANAYVYRSGSADRTTEKNHWDLGLTLSLPLFKGGAIAAGVDGALAKQKEFEIQKTLALREAEGEVLSIREKVLKGLEELKELERALSLSERNHQEQSKDYRLGLVSNLEVLTSLSQLQEVRRSRDRSLFAVLQGYFELQVLTKPL